MAFAGDEVTTSGARGRHRGKRGPGRSEGVRRHMGGHDDSANSMASNLTAVRSAYIAEGHRGGAG